MASSSIDEAFTARLSQAVYEERFSPNLYVIKDAFNYLLGIIAIILALSFTFSVGINHNYDTMRLFFGTFDSWALGFAFYGLSKIVISRVKCWLSAELLLCATGLWAWVYVIISFMIVDSTPAAPLEFLLLMPLLSELWVVCILIFGIRVRYEIGKELTNG